MLNIKAGTSFFGNLTGYQEEGLFIVPSGMPVGAIDTRKLF
jgi:hypothetical protein